MAVDDTRHVPVFPGHAPSALPRQVKKHVEEGLQILRSRRMLWMELDAAKGEGLF